MRSVAQYVVVGGGLAGLTAAIQLASSGASVTVYEQSRTVGGRAITRHFGDYAMNLGPHAFYRAGLMRAQFDAWSIPYCGSPPGRGNSFVIENGARHSFALSVTGLLRCRVLKFWDKLSLGRILKKIQNKPDVGTTESMAAWIERSGESHHVRLFLAALTRLTTYVADLDLLNAGAALRQMRLALAQSVLYLDGGWENLIRSLVEKAKSLNVAICPSCPVACVKEGVVILHGNRRIHAEGIILAVSPDTVEQLTGERLPPRIAARAACLDLGLRREPPQAGVFGLGLDEPIYVSAHSEYASGLAPKGGAMVHLAMYLKHGQSCERKMLERTADVVLPGWRQEVAVSRFLPQMTVMHGIPISGRSRPAVDTLRLSGVMLAGDWVGSEAMLADAAVASGLAAARALEQRTKGMVA